MKFWRAVLIGILLWVLIFAEVSVVKIGLGLSGGLYYAIHFFLSALFVLLCSAIYFRKAEGGLKEGFLLGAVFVVTGSILDLAITVPFFTGFALYDVYMLVGLLEVLVFCLLFGLLLGRKEVRTDYSIGELKREISSSPSFERAEVALPKSVSKLVMDLNKTKMPAKKKTGRKKRV